VFKPDEDLEVDYYDEDDYLYYALEP